MTSLEFLYDTVPGRILLKCLIHPCVSQVCGHFLDSSLSGFLITPFARKNQIILSDYQLDDIHSFNDFFSRKIKPSLRTVDMDPRSLIAPCDGLLSVWKIQKDTVLPIKQSSYTLTDLLRDHRLAARYEDGYCFVFRLCVDHYHRYSYVDSGRKSGNRHIPGVLHTVRPIALRTLPVFTENSREYTLIQTSHLGTLLQMEVGAMLVGRIVNHHGTCTVTRGEEKGFFQYGGSTVIVLVEKDRITVREDLLTHSANDTETPVKLGEVLAYEKMDTEASA